MGKRLVALLTDVVGAPLWALARPLVTIRRTDTIERILVVEIWKLGDAVLATPALQALRFQFPRARITLLAHPSAVALFENTELVDEILPVAFPWTSEVRKYDVRRWDFRNLWKVVRDLRARRFDVAIAARMDPRDHALVGLSGAPVRVGLDHGGGAFFLNHRLPADDGHRVTDWMRLVRHLGYEGAEPSLRLALSDDERAGANRWVRSHSIADGDVIVGIHPGASVTLKRWSAEKFGLVARRAAAAGARVIAFDDPAMPLTWTSMDETVVPVRLPLRQMLAIMERCSVLVANDSGPLHMAAALGVPTVGVFTNQFPELYAPRGESHVVAMLEGFSCRPCFERCVYAEPYCNTGLGVDEVWPLLEKRLELLAAR